MGAHSGAPLAMALCFWHNGAMTDKLAADIAAPAIANDAFYNRVAAPDLTAGGVWADLRPLVLLHQGWPPSPPPLCRGDGQLARHFSTLQGDHRGSCTVPRRSIGEVGWWSATNGLPTSHWSHQLSSSGLCGEWRMFHHHAGPLERAPEKEAAATGRAAAAYIDSKQIAPARHGDSGDCALHHGRPGG